MRSRLPRSLALPVTAAILVLSAAPALAQSTIPTTPTPQPANPGQAPVSSPSQPQPLGHAVGDAGTGLGVLRLLPQAVPTSAILPGQSDQLPKQSVLEGGIGLSSAQANSEAYLTYEKSIAQASPFGLSVAGNAPQVPGSLTQTALPDNEQPTTGGLNAPSNPLLSVGLLNGSAHARYSPTLGPCVGTIADATTSAASLALLPTIPAIPGLEQLTQASQQLKDALSKLPGPLANLGGLLSGVTGTNPNGTGALVSAPNTLSSRSTVKLVDLPKSKNKAVQSISTMQLASVDLLKGTPLALTLKVASQPTLTVTSTGDEKTSTVKYTAPVLTVERNGVVLFTLDARNPTASLPIGIPLPGLKDIPGFENLKNAPIIGGLVQLLDGSLKQLPTGKDGLSLDLGVIKLSVAGLDQKGTNLTDPFKGYQLGASARLMDLQVLPTKALKDALPKDAADKLPSSLAQVSFGEQVARAYAPTGGVQCGTTQPAPPGGGDQPKGNGPKNLAYTSAAYSAVPMFWTGTGMLLVGVVLVAAMPRRRRKPVELHSMRPSPRPRD